MENKKSDTQILAEAFNLLVQADLSGLKGGQVPQVAQTIVEFQAIVAGLNENRLEIVACSDQIEEGEEV